MMGSGKMEAAGPSSGRGEEKKQEEMMEEEENEEEEKGPFGNFVPGPLLPLKEQIEKDKEDESLRRWKEKLLGCLESDLNGQIEPEVKFHSIGIISSDFDEISTPFPINGHQSKQILFTLQEGSEYRLKLTFSVLHNIVSGLAYTNSVWKGGIQGTQFNTTSFSISIITFLRVYDKYLQLIVGITLLSGDDYLTPLITKVICAYTFELQLGEREGDSNILYVILLLQSNIAL
ncbi:hypothetical protein ACS0TY_013212 [Phlomoides rotata]